MPYGMTMNFKLIIIYFSFRKQQPTLRTGGAL